MVSASSEEELSELLGSPSSRGGQAKDRRYGSNGNQSASDSSWQEGHSDVFQTHGPSTSEGSKCWSRAVQVPVLVVLVGVLTASVSVLVNVSIKFSYPVSKSFMEHHASLPLYCAYCVALALLSNAVTQGLCPEAAGGGIPEVKTLLDGSYKRALVLPRTVLAKALGLILSSAAGLSVGKEGPFVHIAVAISDIMMHQPCFKRLLTSDAKKLEIFACAAAAGVGATFGTPFAATMFSIEVTAGYFMIRNLPMCLLCAISGTLTMSLLGYDRVFSLFSDMPKMAQGYHAVDLISFVLLGVVSGFLGCVFIVLVKWAVNFRNDFLNKADPSNACVRRYCYVFVVSIVVAPLVYAEMRAGLPSISGDQHSIVNYMFQITPLGLSIPLLLFLPFKLLVTVACVTLPLPVGLFTPVFLIGGTMGRIFGEGLRLVSNHFLEFHGKSNFVTLQPWEFALIGSAAFSGGVTRAISTALIILELSGEHHLSK